MNSADRMRAILFIWASFGFAAGFAFVGSATSINDIFLALIFATAAVLCTAMVMRSSADERTAQQVLDKAKRGRPDVNVGGIKGPPIPAIVTIIVLIVVGVFVWRRGKSWWMAAGSVLMFIAAMAGVRLLGVGNLGEVAMSSALVDGERVAQGSG